MDNQQINQNQSPTNTTNFSEKPKKSILQTIIVAIIVATVAFTGAYLWQKSKNDDTSAKLREASSKINQLEEQLAAEKEVEEEETTPNQQTTSSTNPKLIPGDTDTRRNDGRILITAAWERSLEPTAVWIEYGTSPEALNKTSAKITRELGMGEGPYSQGFSVSINDSELEPGASYYYRVAATINGETERSAVASFVTDK